MLRDISLLLPAPPTVTVLLLTCLPMAMQAQALPASQSPSSDGASAQATGPAVTSPSGSGALAASSAELPAGTPLWIVSTQNAPLRPGSVVHAQLRDAVYTTSGEVLPAGTPVTAHVTQMVPDGPERLKSRLRGDFTPFRKPVVQFTEFEHNGHTFSLPLSAATEGTPLVSLAPLPPKKGGIIRQQIDSAKQAAKDQLSVFTAPGKRDRLVQLAYKQLPWHPQRIPAGTVWTPELTAATTVPVVPIPAMAANTAAASSKASSGPGKVTVNGATPSKSADPATPADDSLSLHASLDQEIASLTTHNGQPITATVLQPALDGGGNVVVPVGTQVHGVVTRADPPRRFGRAGVLRFRFTEIELPGESGTRNVQTSLGGVDAPTGEHLQLDSEGNSKPAPRDKIVVPLILLTLAARPLDGEEGRAGGGLGSRALASNSLGAIGFLIGTAGGSPNVAAGIGYWGSALSIWDRWIKTGENVRYPRHTRIILTTTFRRGTQLPVPGATPRP